MWIKGPIIMPGYWNKPEATAESVTDGWLHSGDIGYLDEEGFLYITDRAKDMIIRGGENVYCVEIENRLVEHPAIAEAAVIGVPHQSARRGGQGRRAGRAGRVDHRGRGARLGRRDARQLQGAGLRRHRHRAAARATPRASC